MTSFPQRWQPANMRALQCSLSPRRCGTVLHKDLFAAAGLDPEHPPQTWAQLVEYCKKLTVSKDGKTTQYGMPGHSAMLTTGSSDICRCCLITAGSCFNQDQTRFTLDAGGNRRSGCPG